MDTAQPDSACAAPAIDWAGRARRLAPSIAAAAERAERGRRIPADVMAAMHEAELFRMCLPRSIGGGEASLREVVEVLQIVAAADASTAWCLGQGLGCSRAAGFLDRDAAREVFGPRDAVLAWGPPNRSGAAVAVDGGYRVSGAWSFASGIRNASWVGAHCTVREPDGAARAGPDGRPVAKTLLLPASCAEIADVWRVIGLCGTGSDDYAVADRFVPEARSYVRDSAADRREPGPLYRLALTTFYGVAFAGVALGVARALLDAFLTLAADKVAGYTTTTLRDNAAIQQRTAIAEARLGSARAYLLEMVEATWETALRGRDFPVDQRARLRIASSYAIRQARAAADFAYHAAGAGAILEKNPFERRFRDLQAVGQQIQAAPSNFEHAGMALLGLEPGPRV